MKTALKYSHQGRQPKLNQSNFEIKCRHFFLHFLSNFANEKTILKSNQNTTIILVLKSVRKSCLKDDFKLLKQAFVPFSKIQTNKHVYIYIQMYVHELNQQR